MKETNMLINTCSIASILLGLTTMWNMLSLNINTFGIEFINYLLGGFALVMGILTLFREERRTKMKTLKDKMRKDDESYLWCNGVVEIDDLRQAIKDLKDEIWREQKCIGEGTYNNPVTLQYTDTKEVLNKIDKIFGVWEEGEQK